MEKGTESLLDGFLFETGDLLDHLDDILLTCEQNRSFDPDSINEIFRIMHTIKGSSAMLELNSMTTVSHKMEDLVAFVRDKGIGQESLESLINLMFEAEDFLKSEVEKIRSGQPPLKDIGTLGQKINDFLEKISGGAPGPEKGEKTSGNPPAGRSAAESGSGAGEEILKKEAARGFPFSLKTFFDEKEPMANLRAFLLAKQVRDVCHEFEEFPEDIETNPKTAGQIAKKGFFLFFRTREDLKKAESVVNRFPYLKSCREMDPPHPENGETPPPASTLPAGRPKRPAARESLISVSLSKLDSLMDLMGEIVITESMVTSSPALRKIGLDNNFTKASRQLRKLTDELQEVVMSIRMVPISNVFHKMRRIVRDMSRNLKKDAQLVLIGEETEVDKTIIDSISDPIMHLVRNAMDHGIEPKEERLRGGKPATGTITLSAQNTGGDILISVSDDGAGIDRTAVLKKARQKGLLKKHAQEYTDEEVYQFLLMPGFSTNDVVTEYSGRGVGMDVVKKNVEKIGGDISIYSAPRKGTKIVFKIPLTLAIINGMKISVGSTMFTLPIKNIFQSFKASAGSVMYDTDKHEIVMVRNRYYPLIRLHKVYHIDTKVTNVTDGIVILVGTHDSRFCIFADALLGEQQVVVKALPSYLCQFGLRKSGIDGCAILGDGSISLILNVQNLYNRY